MVSDLSYTGVLKHSVVNKEQKPDPNVVIFIPNSVLMLLLTKNRSLA